MGRYAAQADTVLSIDGHIQAVAVAAGIGTILAVTLSMAKSYHAIGAAASRPTRGWFPARRDEH